MKTLISFLALVLFSSAGVAMSFFDGGKSCVFSEVNLSITYQGEPASNAKLWRRISWHKEVIDEFTLDDQGQIELPAEYQRSAGKLFPMEFVVSQVLKVTYQGQEYEIWINSKREASENSELGGQPLNLTCELTDEPEVHEEFDTLLMTSCRW